MTSSMLLLGMLAGCGASHNTVPKLAPGTVTVAIVANAATGGAYEPATLRITPGTTVTWVEHDRRHLHTVTANDNLFGSRFLRLGQSYSVRFNRPGVYLYYCEIHRKQRGEIIVTTGGE